MLLIHQSQYLLQPSKLAECSSCLHWNHCTNFPTVAYANWRCSNPRKFKAQKVASKILFLDKGHRQWTRAQNLDTEFDEVADDMQDDDELDGPQRRFRERAEQRDYDRDPEFAEILGSCLDDPGKAQSKMKERLRKKRSKILHTKTGSGSPMSVTFNKFDFSNSYIWFEFYNSPLQKDISLICDTIRSWHIIGRLGGCNSMNMQLSQSPLDKRPSYDAIEGANVEPTTFYNIGDLEIQDNLARIWVDIGTSEPLLLDVLLNALTQISSDFVGIKQVVFGGSEFENWKESRTTDDTGSSVHKI
uniref:DNA-directed RNA polymerase n=2 Tax=Opuntia streptacantha TaxID=393608 RepID=A0A7C8YU46_OPUST